MKKPKTKYSQTVDGTKLSPGKIALRASLAVGIILLLSALIFVFLPQIYLNGLLKSRIIDAFQKAYPEYSLKIAGVNYNILKNRLECDSISLTKISADKRRMIPTARLARNAILPGESFLPSMVCRYLVFICFMAMLLFL